MFHAIDPVHLADILRHLTDDELTAVVESSDYETLVTLRDLAARQVEALDLEATMIRIEAGEL